MWTIDTHCDSIDTVGQGADCIVNAYNMGSEHIQFAALFTDRPGLDEEAAWQLLCQKRAALKEQAEKFPDKLALCRSVTEAGEAIAAGKKALFFSMEGASALAGRRDRLDEVKKDGLCVLSMTWNQNNRYGCANTCSGTADDTGLTPEGHQLVRDCDNRRILIDVSHASDNTTLDILRTTNLPVLATHSNFRAVCGHKRNLTDQQALAIKASGGVIGFNLYAPFMGGGDMEALLPQLEYGLKLVGEDHLGFGCDIDGIDVYPAGLDMGRSIHEQLIEMLRRKGYGEELIEKLAYKNFLRVMRYLWP